MIQFSTVYNSIFNILFTTINFRVNTKILIHSLDNLLTFADSVQVQGYQVMVS